MSRSFTNARLLVAASLCLAACSDLSLAPAAEVAVPETMAATDDANTPTAAEPANAMYLVMPVLLEGGGGEGTTVQEVEEFRAIASSIDPDSHVTWAMTTRFAFGEENRPTIAKVLDFVEEYGDTISYGVGFANNMSVEQFKVDFHDFLYMFRYNSEGRAGTHEHGTSGEKTVWESIPTELRPVAVVDYSINQEQLIWLNENYGIDTSFWAATQYQVDGLSGEGSPLLPYYAHRNNTIVPAQDPETNSGVVVLNAITVDPIGSRYTSGESRFTIHPADPLVEGGEAQIKTIDQYVSNPYNKQNTINYLSLLVDINWVWRTPALKASWDEEMKALEGLEPTLLDPAEFADLWQARGGDNNELNSFTLQFHGTGAEASDGHRSDADTTYLWTETREQRVILAKRDGEEAWSVIDFTDYAAEDIPTMTITELGNKEDVSFVSGRNFKLAPTQELTNDQWLRIADRLTAIGFTDPVGELPAP